MCSRADDPSAPERAEPSWHERHAGPSLSGVVTVTRRTLPAGAACLECQWKRTRKWGLGPAAVPMAARRHVARTGHGVRVTVERWTEYGIAGAGHDA